jgi:hypothetical protein
MIAADSQLRSASPLDGRSNASFRILWLIKHYTAGDLKPLSISSSCDEKLDFLRLPTPRKPKEDTTLLASVNLDVATPVRIWC